MKTLATPWFAGRTSAGVTLGELIVALAILGLLLALTLPRYKAATDRAAVQSAVEDAEGVFGSARRSAITRRTLVAVAIDTASGSLTIRAAGTRLGFESLGSQFGVQLGSTRDSMSYDARGLGYGAADLSLYVRRGQAAETLFIARLGRVRH
ncbi:MAG TPA: hypothetical protein VMH39_04300 [Gemmatimonadaceae bacterium]|nr:hypothetical protein [Gemmatimonadaceae bacterium]